MTFPNVCGTMLKRILVFFFCLFFLGTCFGNILKNGEFQPDPGSGKMTGWTARSDRVKEGRTACVFQDGAAVLTLEEGEKMTALVQRDLSLKPGQRYRLTFEARGTEGTQLSDYLEWVLVSGEYGNSGTFGREIAPEWKTYSSVLKAPDGKCEFKSAPYFAFCLKTPGKAEIRHVILEEAVPEEKKDPVFARIADPGFDNPEEGAWKLQKNSRILTSGGRTSPGVLELKGKNASASLDLHLAPGKIYRLSYFVKSRNDSETSSGFSDFLCVLKLNGKTLRGTDRKQDCIQGWWQERSQLIRVPKDGNAGLKITVRSLSAGDVLFDDFAICETTLMEEKPLQILLDAPAYRNMIFSSDPIDFVRGKIRTKQAVESIRVTFNGNAVSVRPGEEFSFPAQDLKTGEYDLAAEALTSDGKKLTETLTVRKLPPAENEVIFNSRKQLLVNGKPFFFSGVNNILSQTINSPAVLYYAKRTGLCIKRWAGADDVRTTLDLCHKMGIKVSLNLGVVTRYARAGSAEKFKADWEKQLPKLNALKQHPAVIEYYTFDEPLWNGVPLEIMKYVYESLKEMDPYHPVVYVEAPRGTPDDWRPYAQYCDIFGIDVYPVPEESGHSELPEKGPRSVGLYTRLSEETVDGRKPVRMWVQAFDWGNLTAKRKDFHRSPTQEEFRFMNFDVLLHGGSSVDFYRDKNTDEEAEKYMFREINLFSRFAPALVFGKTIHDGAEPSGHVLTRITEYKGDRYMVMLNRGDETASAMLPEGADWYRMEPGEAIPVKDRKIELPKLSCRLFSTAKELPLENTMPASPGMEEKMPCLFKHITLRPRLLASDAKWIWTADRKDRFCCAVRKVGISRPVKRAVLRMTADDEFIACLDGKKIFAGSDWKHLSVCDLAEKLNSGTHTLAVYAVNNGGPGAIIGDLVIEYEDGTKEVIVTDSSWSTSSRAFSDGKDAPDTGSPANEIAPLGKGPWKI